MDELFILLCVLGIVLGIVTLVGHGIWVVLARLFGARRIDTPVPPLPAAADICPRCWARMHGPNCPVCLWPQPTKAHALQPNDLASQRRIEAALSDLQGRLTHFEQLGLVDAEIRNQLRAAIEAQQIRLAEIQQAAAKVKASKPRHDEATRAATRSPLTPAPPPAAEVAQPSPPAEQTEVPVAPAQRARRYMASRQAAAKEVAPPAPRPRPALARLFAAFIEEKNIRWGELVGGLLIVCSSVALVISFWSEIADRPFLKFFLFGGVTASLFGVGFYTDRRWKIHTTSHGVLTIAMLLVPLNFLAIAAFTRHTPPADLISISGEAISLCLFSWLVWAAGRIVVPRQAQLLTVGVMIPCLMQLVIRRLAAPETPIGYLHLLVAVPIVCYSTTTSLGVRKLWRRSVLSARAVGRMFLLLGIVSAATVLPLALLLASSPPPLERLHILSPWIVPCGLPGLLVGLLCWCKATGPRLGGWQTAGLSIGVLGVLVMLGASVLAWPEMATLLPVALTVGGLLTLVAAGFDLPAAHLPGALALAGAGLLIYHWGAGHLAWHTADSQSMRQALWSASSGHALVPLAGLMAAVAIVLIRLKQREAAAWYGVAAASTAGISLALVTWFGLGQTGDPHGATWIYAIDAVVALAGSVWLGRQPKALSSRDSATSATMGQRPRAAVHGLAWLGLVLLLLALVQGFVYRPLTPWQQPWIVALLLHATLAIVIGSAQRWLRPEPMEEDSNPWSQAALATSLAAAAWLVWRSPSAGADTLAIHSAWLATVWLALAWLANWSWMFAAGQLAGVAAVVFFTTAMVSDRDWYFASPHPWLDPWFLAAQGIALSVYTLAWKSARRLLRAWSGRPFGPGLERLLEAGVVGLLLGVCTYGILPGVSQELAPVEVVRVEGGLVGSVPLLEQFEIAQIPHRHAIDRGAWLLWVAVAALLILAPPIRSGHAHAGWRLAGLLLVAMAACMLLAARWEDDVAVASALRWLTAAGYLAASVPIWFRNQLPVGCRRWATGNDRGAKTSRPVATDGTAARSVELTQGKFSLAPLLRGLLLLGVVAVYAVMALMIATGALAQVGLSARMGGLLPYLECCAVVAGLSALGLRLLAGKEMAGSRAAGNGRQPVSLASHLLLLLGIGPLLVLLTAAVAAALGLHPLVGPEPGSWFQRIGWSVSYSVPLVVIAVTLVGYAIREHSSGYAFGAGLLLNVVATLVLLIRLHAAGRPFDAETWIFVAQANACVSALAALAWRGARGWRGAIRASGERPPLLLTQVLLAASLCAVVIVPAVLSLAWNPIPPAWVLAVAGPSGWLAVALVAAAATWIAGSPDPQRQLDRLGLAELLGLAGLLAATLVAMAALAAARLAPNTWLGYHTLLGGCTAAAWCLPLALPAAGRFGRGTPRNPQSVSTPSVPLAGSAPQWSTTAATWFAAFAMILALRSLAGDPAAPWWAIGPLLALSARAIWGAYHDGRRGGVWRAAFLFHLAVTLWWLHSGNLITGTQGPGSLSELLWINMLAGAIMSALSLVVERRLLAWPRQTSAQDPLSAGSLWKMKLARLPQLASAHGRPSLGLHRVAAWIMLLVLLATTGGGLWADWNGHPIEVDAALAWAAWLAALATAIGCWWDPATRWPIGALYLIGLTAVGLLLDSLDVPRELFSWALACALGAYSLTTSTLWSGRTRWVAAAARRGIPLVVDHRGTANNWPQKNTEDLLQAGQRWLVGANGLLALIVLGLVLQIEISTPAWKQRMVAAYALGASVLALGLLAHGAVRSSLQYATLVGGGLFAVAFGWAWLPPDFPAPWLHRLIVAGAALTVVTGIYAVGLVKLLRRDNEWTRAARQLVPALSLVTTILLIGILVLEILTTIETGSAPAIAWPALVAVAAALVGLALVALGCALLPGRDPLGLSERGRTAYVYAAEGLLALLGLHLRVTMPWLFSGWFLRIWPLAVMGLAFVGVGLGELFRRRRQRVLSTPLETTGILLPLLPVLGFSFVSSQVHYSLLLLSVGLLYAAQSVLRRSYLFGILAALAANGSLWYLLWSHDGMKLTDHPQLWLIPPALSVLMASHLNRRRLGRGQLATIRYATAIVIYVSSTVEIFLHGVAEVPWLPAVLAGLSILGVLAGIWLRIRAFLYLGTSFLLVALLTVIWHAAASQQRTWIWWIAGLVTGVLILALFGLFERRRDDVLQMVEKLKQWDE